MPFGYLVPPPPGGTIQDRQCPSGAREHQTPPAAPSTERERRESHERPEGHPEEDGTRKRRLEISQHAVRPEDEGVGEGVTGKE